MANERLSIVRGASAGSLNALEAARLIERLTDELSSDSNLRPHAIEGESGTFARVNHAHCEPSTERALGNPSQRPQHDGRDQPHSGR
jgi:hypothetical protein